MAEQPSSPTTAIFVSGLPASGKSTLAKAIAQEMSWPFRDKDDYLEELFESEGVNSLEERRTLSRKSDRLFVQGLASQNNMVLVSHWKSEEGLQNSGTSLEPVFAAFERVVEVYCSCDVETAVDRFMKRRRHPGHFDDQRSLEEVSDWFLALSRAHPIGADHLVTVDTNSQYDPQAVFDRIRQELDL